MTTVVYTTPNMSCQHCVHTIQSELSDLAGVKSVVANVNDKTTTVTFEPPATEEQIKALLVEINYPVAN